MIERPDATTILGATKVTGKSNGWTYGGLTALTDREYGLVTTDARRTATLVAQGPAEILTLDYPRFRQFVLAYPQCVLAMLGVTVNRLQSEVARGHKARPGP